MDKITQILENVVRCKYFEAGVHIKNPILMLKHGLMFGSMPCGVKSDHNQATYLHAQGLWRLKKTLKPAP
jgi:hypothetical protein